MENTFEALERPYKAPDLYANAPQFEGILGTTRKKKRQVEEEDGMEGVVPAEPTAEGSQSSPQTDALMIEPVQGSEPQQSPQQTMSALIPYKDGDTAPLYVSGIPLTRVILDPGSTHSLLDKTSAKRH